MGWIKEIISEEKRKHHDMQWGEEKYNLNWAKLAEDKIIETIMKYYWSNNTIKFKNCNARLAVTDGGWVNAMELHNFLKGALKDEDL